MFELGKPEHDYSQQSALDLWRMIWQNEEKLYHKVLDDNVIGYFDNCNMLTWHQKDITRRH